MRQALESRYSLTATRPGESVSQTFASLEAALRIARTYALRGFVCRVVGLSEADDVGEIFVTAERAA